MNHIIIFVAFINTLCAGLSKDDPCIFELTNSPGVCTPLSRCDPLRHDLIIHNRLPQTCGFEGTQAIVCCPKETKRGTISKKKCKEYSVYGMKNNTKPNESTKNECGHLIVKRVVGGVKASNSEFPHMALLGFKDNSGEIKWKCGGSIISDQYILTVANCQTRKEGTPIYVKVGITNINDVDHKQEIMVSEFITHPNYSRISVYNDIALVKLEKPIDLNSYARPACLYSEEEIAVGKAVATGWGKTDVGLLSDDLLKVTLDLVDHESCKNFYGKLTTNSIKYGIVKESQMCAGGDKKDSCQGDTGGPLQIYRSSEDTFLCMYDIVGITSFGLRICGIGPGVYTKVSNYINWIEGIVWPESD